MHANRARRVHARIDATNNLSFYHLVVVDGSVAVLAFQSSMNNIIVYFCAVDQHASILLEIEPYERTYGGCQTCARAGAVRLKRGNAPLMRMRRTTNLDGGGLPQGVCKYHHCRV